MQIDNSKSLNLWKFHENGINVSVLLALPSFQQSSENNTDIGRVKGCKNISRYVYFLVTSPVI